MIPMPMSEHEEAIFQNCQKLAVVNSVYKFQPKKGKEKDIYRFQQKEVQEGIDPFGSNLK